MDSVQVGDTFLVQLNRLASQREFNQQLDAVRIAGGRYWADEQVWIVCPKIKAQAMWLGELSKYGATVIS